MFYRKHNNLTEIRIFIVLDLIWVPYKKTGFRYRHCLSHGNNKSQLAKTFAVQLERWPTSTSIIFSEPQHLAMTTTTTYVSTVYSLQSSRTRDTPRRRRRHRQWTRHVGVAIETDLTTPVPRPDAATWERGRSGSASCHRPPRGVTTARENRRGLGSRRSRSSESQTSGVRGRWSRRRRRRRPRRLCSRVRAWGSTLVRARTGDKSVRRGRRGRRAYGPHTGARECGRRSRGGGVGAARSGDDKREGTGAQKPRDVRTGCGWGEGRGGRAEE